MSTALGGIEVVEMDFKKITISVPARMYKEAMLLVRKGLFSNFSDLVRSGIREEMKDLRFVVKHMDEDLIYRDKELVKGVSQSLKDVKLGKGKKFKNEEEMAASIDRREKQA